MFQNDFLKVRDEILGISNKTKLIFLFQPILLKTTEVLPNSHYSFSIYFEVPRISQNPQIRFRRMQSSLLLHGTSYVNSFFSVITKGIAKPDVIRPILKIKKLQSWQIKTLTGRYVLTNCKNLSFWPGTMFLCFSYIYAVYPLCQHSCMTIYYSHKG